MATNVSSIGTGGDYTTITAWEAAVQGDLVTAGDIEKGECKNEAFTARVTIDGSTTDASNYLWLTVESGAEHDMTAGGGPRIAPTSGTGHLLTVSDPFTRIEGLEFDLSNTTGTSDECIRVNADNILIRKCLMHTGTARTNQDGVYLPPSGWTLTVENCVIFGFGRAGIHFQNWTGTGVIHGIVANCTIRGCGNEEHSGGILMDNRSAQAGVIFDIDNCIALDNDTDADADDYFVRFGSTNYDDNGGGNISSDGSATSRFGSGNGNLNNRTATANTSPGAGDWVVFVNITGGSEDYHLQTSAENDAEGNGLDLSGSFSDDFDGDTRSDWDSGADEIVAAAAPTSLPLFPRRSQRALLVR